jgi:hypothetical protein
MIDKASYERPHVALKPHSTFWARAAGQLETYVCSACGSQWQRLTGAPGVAGRHWLAVEQRA